MAAAEPCIVTIDNTGESFACGAECVLDAAIAAGVQVPYNCRGGACGTCKAEVLQGAVEHGLVMGFAISDEEIAAGRCLICSSRPSSARLVVRMLNHHPTARRPALPVAEHAGVVVAVHGLTPSVRRLEVMLTSSAPFRYDCGMYVDLAIGGTDEVRPYSIATVPSADGTAPDGCLRFMVARHPHGRVSGAIHDTLQVGDPVSVRGPYGTFRLPPASTGPVLMLAGGTGLAPLIPMTHALLGRSPAIDVDLWFSVRARPEIFALDELSRLKRRHRRFRYKMFLTREQSVSGSGFEQGRIPVRLEHSELVARAGLVLVCGSPGFVRDCVAALGRCGVDAGRILVEAYEPRPSAEMLAERSRIIQG